MSHLERLAVGAALVTALLLGASLANAQNAAAPPCPPEAVAPPPCPPEEEWDWLRKVAANSWIVHNGEMPKTKAPPVEKPLFEKSWPVSFRLEYGLATDYVWRGINFSEYPGEGREDLNHQLGTGLEVDTGKCGIFGAAIWFDWFAGSDELEDRKVGCDPLENDYTVYWRYACKPIATTVEIGWSCIRWPAAGPSRPCAPEEPPVGPPEPPAPDPPGNTQEVYVRIQFDDSRLWNRQSSCLNPYVFWAIDYDATDCGQWLEVGLKPVLVMADCQALRNVPVVRDMWISPTISLGIDHRYLGPILSGGRDCGKTTKLANIVYGVEVGYDIGRALKMPREYGSVIVTGFLDYSQALSDSLLDDHFWGGFKIAYSW